MGLIKLAFLLLFLHQEMFSIQNYKRGLLYFKIISAYKKKTYLKEGVSMCQQLLFFLDMVTQKNKLGYVYVQLKTSFLQ